MKLHSFITSKYVILLLFIWQFFSLLLIALGYWPKGLVWLNLGLGTAFLALAEPFNGLLFTLASVPFYVALPNARFETLSVWRIWYAALFGFWLLRTVYSCYAESESKSLIAALKKRISFLPWDRYLGIFAVVALVSLFFARFPMQGLKQVLFWINIYLLYIVLVNTVNSYSRVVDVVKYSALSLGAIVMLGYAQLITTFFMDLEMFWVFWASQVSRLYYGFSFMEVSLYSNSWFSFNGGRELRMFSIMPDSHSFALLCVFAMGFLLSLTYLYRSKRKLKLAAAETGQDAHWWQKRVELIGEQNKMLGIRVNYKLWSGIRFAGLALILSGTRAVWVGMLAPLAAVLWAYRKDFARVFAKKTLWPLLFVILFFALSPFINKGLQYIRFGGFQENFLDRARTIYDLQEDSNALRLQMWKNSLAYSLAHPWGTGLNNFIVSLSPQDKLDEGYEELADSVNKKYNLPQKYVTAHNLYLQVLVETGLFGLVALAAFLWKYATAVYGFLKARVGQDNIAVFFVAQAFLSLLWIFASAAFDVTLYNDKVLVYFFVSLGLTGAIMNNYDKFDNHA